MNSSLLSGTSSHPISNLSSVPQTSSTLAQDEGLGTPPMFNDDSLPPMQHAPVQAGHAGRWSAMRVDELVKAVVTSLRVWVREKEQMLMLKRLLARSRCIDGEKSDIWYKREIRMLEVSATCGTKRRNLTNAS